MTEEALAAPPHVPDNRIVDFDVYHPPGLEKDFHMSWKSLQDGSMGNLVWTPRNGGHWLVTKGEDIARFMADYQHFSSRIMQVPRERSIGNNPIPGSMDPPEQVPFRALLNAPLSAVAVHGMEETIRDLARELIDRVVTKGECEFVSEFALALPLSIFLRYADLPIEDLPYLRSLAEEKVRPSGKMPVAEVMKALADYLGPYIQKRQAEPGEDLVSRLVSGKVFGRPVAYDEAIRLCSQVLVAGLDTVATSLSFATWFLATHPEMRQRLLDQPELIPTAVEEFLRRFPLVAIARELVDDYAYDGTVMQKGDIIVLPTMLHGLDERSFTNAMDFQLDRPRSVNSTFGQGPHRCPGSFLARAELRIFLEEWLKSAGEFRLKPGTTPEFKSGVVGTIAHLELEFVRP
ncbi:MAG: cytochrome P450 [Sphingomonadaceae bacterium]